MEESKEILLSSLKNMGVSIPNDVSSIKDMTPAALVSICAQSLNLIDNSRPFSTSLPDSMAEKFKICTDISSAIKNLGYIGDISYYKFLYPSEEDLYKLIRFLVERLSESPNGVKTGDVKNVNARRKMNKDNFESTSKDNKEAGLDHQKVGEKLEECILKDEVPESSNSKAEAVSVNASCKVHFVPQKMVGVTLDDESSYGIRDSSKNDLTGVASGKDCTEESGKSVEAFENEQTAVRIDGMHISAFGQKSTSLKEQSSKTRNKAENSQNLEQGSMEAVTAKTSELRDLEEEFELLKAAVEMAFDDSHPTEFHLEQLAEQVESRKQNLVELESQWNAFRITLEEKGMNLEESLYVNEPEAREKLQKLKEVEVERKSVLSEIRKREDEYHKLFSVLEKQPMVAPRRSYIERIKEITKNSRKQDADIERIRKETRELQLESNSIQERLHRAYAVVDDMIFREAKKDQIGRQAYRLLTSIHESFEQVSEKILATDRVRREIAEYEKKLAAISSRSLNVDKLQADLDAIMKENEFLEQQQQLGRDG